ncbi:MAG: ubiquinone/menaquinone biosynthesis methyltransferase [Desulfovibrionaceae bacterium]|nr:ubiquinone/menaquinone biosynthesis methyltransferase [Desulfovibrionaceae bacterium]
MNKYEQKSDTFVRPNISKMFSGIVCRYDILNRVLSCNLDQYWRFRLVREVFPESKTGKGLRCLDLAAGTLDVSLALQKRYREAEVWAMDFCFSMMRQGLHKIRRDNPMRLSVADARLLPLPDACVDGVTMSFGIRNIVPRESAFREMLRVLKPGSRACILEFGTGRKKIFFGLYNFYLQHILPVIGRISGDASAYEYLAESIMRFPSAPELAAEMEAAGFRNVRYIPLVSGSVNIHIGERP